VPFAFIRKISNCPLLRSELKKIWAPSLLHWGIQSSAELFVTFVAPEPSRFIVKMSPRPFTTRVTASLVPAKFRWASSPSPMRVSAPPLEFTVYTPKSPSGETRPAVKTILDESFVNWIVPP
jgi:hypothetical protein